MPLAISITTGGEVPIYRQIADQISRAIATGQIVAGDQVPSVRDLAEQLVVNVNTVRRTYAGLIRDGLLESHQGKGVYVAERRAIYTKAERLRRIDAALEAFVNEGIYLGFTLDDLRAALERKFKMLAVEMKP